MDFFLGIILGVLGAKIHEQIIEIRRKKNSPKRGRPPKKITVKQKEKEE